MADVVFFFSIPFLILLTVFVYVWWADRRRWRQFWRWWDVEGWWFFGGN
jgi:hypothetical protein